MGYHDLVLDSALRDWVFIPLTLTIVFMKLLTQYFHTVRQLPSPRRRGCEGH